MRDIFIENQHYHSSNVPKKPQHHNNSSTLFSKSTRISVELCPDKSLDATEIEKLAPAYSSVTWRSQSNVALQDIAKISAVSLCKQLSSHGNHVMLHLSGRNVNKSEATDILNELQRMNVRNVLALKGESSHEYEDKADFRYASDLVRFIKQNYGDYFYIGVAGYPNSHPLERNKTDDLNYLKLKVEAGADFIITQMFFDSETFSSFYKNCRRIGIKVPIVPGICVINSYQSLTSMAKFCKVQMPKEMTKVLLCNKENAEAIRNYGIFHCSQLIKDVFLETQVPNVHFFSLNNVKLVRYVCKALGLCDSYIYRPLLNKNYPINDK